MSICTLYIVRHGQSVFNRDDVLSGHGDPDLTDQGKTQAKALAGKLSHINFDEIYTSDLQRAIKTAELISGSYVPKEHQLTQLRERSFGQMEGKSAQHWRDMHQAEHYQKLSDDKRWTYKHRPDMESDHEVSERYIEAIQDLAKHHPGKTLLIVAHGGALRALLIKLGYATLSDLPPEAMQNTSYAKLIYDGHGLKVEETAGINKSAGL
jgi:broad specificity phosphatase PhoE